MAKTYQVPNSNITYDNDGVGGFVDGFIVGAIPFLNGGSPLPMPEAMIIEKGKVVQPNYFNLKTQCYFKLAEMIQNGEIYVDCKDGTVVDELSKELEQVKRDKIDGDGKLRILPKEKVKELIGRSPDYSDALMMRMYFCFKPDFFIM